MIDLYTAALCASLRQPATPMQPIRPAGVARLAVGAGALACLLAALSQAPAQDAATRGAGMDQLSTAQPHR